MILRSDLLRSKGQWRMSDIIVSTVFQQNIDLASLYTYFSLR
jgi:hypothetical protein